MKFVAIRSNIRDAISVIERAAGENLNLPILKNVFIEAGNSGVTFTATNLELAITCYVSGKVIENGKITVPLALFSNLIANLQSDRLNFEKKGNAMEIKTDNYNATIQGLPAEDFPITPKVKDSGEYLEIKSVLLKEAIQQTMVASQFSDLRPELNAILFDFSLDNLKLAATDGFRLTEKTLSQNLFTAKYHEPFRMLIPLKTSQEALRMSKDDEIMKIYHDENQVLFKTDRAELISRLIEGSFPDYSAIIPKSFATEVVVNREEFTNAIRLASVFGQKTSELKINIYPAKKAVEVSSADQALGENNYLLPAKIKGDAIESFFNWRYLADPIKTMRTEEIFIGFQEETNPALLRPMNDNSYFYILKPILKS
jgi:DNA polymerase III subunit beta